MFKHSENTKLLWEENSNAYKTMINLMHGILKLFQLFNWIEQGQKEKHFSY